MVDILRRLGLLGGAEQQPQGLQALQQLLDLPTPQAAQDLVSALLLSECVYKGAENGGPEAALQALNLFASQFPQGLSTLRQVQFARSHVSHRYMLGRGEGALYVCFMGTKELRDYLADLNLIVTQLWAAGSTGPGAGATGLEGAGVHRGFLSRSEGIPIESLHAHARRDGLRLVLCGHSLGGAVAALCMLRLLASLPRPPPPSQLCCLGFGCPAFGNAALATLVHNKGWDGHFVSYAIPEDPVPRLYLFRAAPTVPSSSSSSSQQLQQQQQQEQQQQQQEQRRQPPNSTSAALEALESEEAQAPAERVGPGLESSPVGKPAAPGAPALGGLSRLAWAAGALTAVANTAKTGASRLVPTYPPLPSFTHFGSQRYLLPTRVTRYPPAPSSGNPTVAPSTAQQAGPSGAATAARGTATSLTAEQQQQQQSLLAAHRMASYRARVLAICQHAGQGQQAQHAQQGQRPGQGLFGRLRWRWGPAQQAEQEDEVALAELAPLPLVQRAVADLPPLLPPLLPARVATGSSSSPSRGQQQQQASQQPASAAAPLQTGAASRLPTEAEGSGRTDSSAGSGSGTAGSSGGGGSVGSSTLGSSSGAPAGSGSPSRWARGLARLRAAPRWRLPPGTAGTAGADSAMPAPAAGTPSVASGPTLPAQVLLRVAVQGAGLDLCTAAWLCLPNSTQLEAVRMDNQASRRLQQELAAAHSGEVTGDQQGGSGQSGFARHVLGRAVPRRSGEGPSAAGQGKEAAAAAAAATLAGGEGRLLLEFAVPPAALLQLRLARQAAKQASPTSESPQGDLSGTSPPQPTSSGSLSLRLATDFGTAAAPVQLKAQVAWVLGPDPALGAALFGALAQAAELQAAALAGLHPAASRRWLAPFGAARGAAAAASLAGGVGRGAQAAQRAVRSMIARREPPKPPTAAAGAAPTVVEAALAAAGAAAAGEAVGAGAEQSAASRGGTVTAAAAAAAAAGQQWRQSGSQGTLSGLPLVGRLRRTLSGGARRLWPPQLRLSRVQQAPEAVLAQGVTLVDASQLALQMPSSMQQRPGWRLWWPGLAEVNASAQHSAAVRLVRLQHAAAWQLQLIAEAVRRKGLQQLEQRLAGSDRVQLLAELADAEVADEDLALGRQLSMGAKLRRRMAQASRAVRHRAALLRRWPALRDAPHPNLLLLVAEARLLPSFLLGPSKAAASRSAEAAASLPLDDQKQQQQQQQHEKLSQQPDAAAAAAGPQEGRLAEQSQLSAGFWGSSWGAGVPWSPSGTQGAQEEAAREVLSQLQRLVGLARAFGMQVLLAVVSQTPLDAAARRRLAASTGLDGSPGAVVPVLLAEQQPDMGGCAQELSGPAGAGQWRGLSSEGLAVGLLQEALYAHAMVLHQAAAERQQGWGEGREGWLRSRL